MSDRNPYRTLREMRDEYEMRSRYVCECVRSNKYDMDVLGMDVFWDMLNNRDMRAVEYAKDVLGVNGDTQTEYYIGGNIGMCLTFAEYCIVMGYAWLLGVFNIDVFVLSKCSRVLLLLSRSDELYCAGLEMRDVVCDCYDELVYMYCYMVGVKCRIVEVLKKCIDVDSNAAVRMLDRLCNVMMREKNGSDDAAMIRGELGVE